MNAILAKIKTQAEVKLFDLKDKAESEGKKQVAKYKDKLPNQDQIAEKLGKYTKGMCAPAKKQKLEARYNKLKNLLTKAQTVLGLSQAAIAGLLGLLKIIDKLIKILETIIKVLNVILKVLKIVIKIAKIVVKFLGGTGTGGFIDLLSRLITKAEYKIKGWSEAVKRVVEWIKKIRAKYIAPIKKILDKILKAISKVLAAISGLIAILELLYLFLLSKCTLDQETANSTTSEGGTRGLGTAGDGSGETGTGDGFDGNGNDGEQLARLAGVLETGTPEQIMARYAGTGNQEYIHYVERAGFESFGYERFYAALGREGTVQANTTFGAHGSNYSSKK